MNNANPKPLPFKQQLRDKWKYIFYVVLLFVVIATAYFLPVDVSTAKGLLIGGICGIAGHYMATRVAELNLPKKFISLREMNNYLSSIKYIKVDGHMTYSPDIHRLLRFKAQDIFIDSKDEYYCIFGPIYVLKKMKNKIERESLEVS